MDVNYFDALLYIAELLKEETYTHVQVSRSFKNKKMYSISFEDCETKSNESDVILNTHFSKAETLEEAAEDYFNHLKGQLLVFHAYSSRRYEVMADTLIEKWNQYVAAQEAT